MEQSIDIKEGNTDQVYNLYKAIPEFNEPYPIATLYDRLKVKHLILIAHFHGLPVGFKIGYQINDSCFYSWLGGVLPQYRKHKIASKLIIAQENWAKTHHYSFIKIKTRNCFKGMLILLIKHNYLIKKVEKKSNINQARIIFLKKLV